MPVAVAEPMAKKAAKPAANPQTSVRISEEALRWARIVCGYTGEPLGEYVSKLVIDKAKPEAKRLAKGLHD